MPEFEIQVVLPTLVPAAYGLLLLLFTPALRDDRRWLWAVSLGGMALAAFFPAWLLFRAGATGETAGLPGRPMVVMDPLSLWLDLLFAIAGFLALLLVPAYLDRARAHRPEIYPLMLIAVAGMTILVATTNLVMIFLGLEVLSIPLYVMSGLTREREASIEAAFKYFLLGAVAAAFLVYGIALVYAATGHLDLGDVATAAGAVLETGGARAGLLAAGLAMILVAFAFKVGAVPFHFWAPDVYQGAPTPVTAFMAVGTKAAAFGVLLRLLPGTAGAAEALARRWLPVVAALAVATMVGGNLVALVQVRVKRMLAWSSIAHAGYLLLALLAPLAIGARNLLFYLVVYTFMTIGAFAVVSLFQEEEGDDADHLDRFAGLWKRRPLLAIAMGIFMLSLTGIPPMGGFTGKYVIFVTALRTGHPVLAAVMGLAAVVGAAYYLRVITTMFLREPSGELPAGVSVSLAPGLVLAVSAVLTIVLGLAPGLVLGPLGEIASGMIGP